MKTTEIHIGHPSFGIHIEITRRTFTDWLDALIQAGTMAATCWLMARRSEPAEPEEPDPDFDNEPGYSGSLHTAPPPRPPPPRPTDPVSPEPPSLDSFVSSWTKACGHPELEAYLAAELVWKDPAEWSKLASELWPRMTDPEAFARYFAEGNRRQDLVDKVAETIEDFEYPDWGRVAWGVLAANPPRPVPEDAIGASI